MASHKPGDNIAWKAPDGAVLEGTVVFAHDDGVLRVRKKGASEDVRIKALSITNSTPYSNGRQKAETYLNQRMKDAGVRVENAARSKKFGRYEFVTKDNSRSDKGSYVEWEVYRDGSIIAEGDASDDAAALRQARAEVGF